MNRLETTDGAVCRTGRLAAIHGFGAHHGEEPPLRGRYGSGTLFFSQCNLRCVFCQNWETSQKGIGTEVEAGALAARMLHLQEAGCHNINFVTPSHVVAQILEAVLIAAREGLHLPLVYNTGGYDSPEALALLEGVIDIYMPDMKYGDSRTARRYSRVRGYWEVNQAAVREMHRRFGRRGPARSPGATPGAPGGSLEYGARAGLHRAGDFTAYLREPDGSVPPLLPRL
jgi:putative pyruvate formate lyase activating enzyme